MKKKLLWIPILFAICFSIFIFPTGSVASANSALKYWHGVTASGALVTDENVPIVVEKENLTFDINGFPTIYGDNSEFDQEYTSKVTAEYNFYNPTEYDVTATLVFPYGNVPYYFTSKDSVGKGYGVMIDGTPVDSQARFTYNRSNSYEFDYKEAVNQVCDTYKIDDFYYPDMPVYKYSYQVLDTSYGRCVVNFNLNYDVGVKYYVAYGGVKENADKTITYTVWVEPNKTIEFYAIGRDVEIERYTFYENNAKDAEQCNGTLSLTSKSETTFKELALSMRDENSNVTEVDWYNATIDMLNDEYGSVNGDVALSLYLNDYLMGWYKYELIVPAGGRVINTVTAPLYPNIDAGYEPPKYEYNYLLSPANSWASFGELTININTTAYMLDNSLVGFEKVDTGYKLVRNGLPDEELIFTLCAEERPKKEINWGYYLIILIPIAILVTVVAIIITIVVVVKKKRKKAKK